MSPEELPGSGPENQEGSAAGVDERIIEADRRRRANSVVARIPTSNWDMKRNIFDAFPQDWSHKVRYAAVAKLIEDLKSEDLWEQQKNGSPPPTQVRTCMLRYVEALNFVSTREGHIPLCALYGHTCFVGCKCWEREETNKEFARTDGRTTWVTLDDFEQYVATPWQLKWWTDRVWYYYMGLTDNQYFKTQYFEFRGRVDKRLKWVDRVVQIAHESWQRKEHPNRKRKNHDAMGMMEDFSDGIIDGNIRWNDPNTAPVDSDGKPLLIDEKQWDRLEPHVKWVLQLHRMQVYLKSQGWAHSQSSGQVQKFATHRNHHTPDALLVHMKQMEELLADQFHLLYLASTGVQHLLPGMFLLRKRIQSRELDNISAADDLLAWTNSFNVLADNWRMSIENNDQLPFKAFLFLINIMTFLGQYVYYQYISPERIYKCEIA